MIIIIRNWDVLCNLMDYREVTAVDSEVRQTRKHNSHMYKFLIALLSE